MTVGKLIEILQTIEDPNKEIIVSDTAAGSRDIKEIEDSFGFHYTIKTERPKRR